MIPSIYGCEIAECESRTTPAVRPAKRRHPRSDPYFRQLGPRAVSILLSLLLLCPSHGWGQQPQGLKIVVLAGEGAINNIEKRVVTEPVIEVQDEQGRPVAGAEVVFTCPPTGPSATFFGASRTLTVNTDDTGQARAGGISPNTEEGTFLIDVKATFGELEASVTIAQTNAIAPAAPKGKKKAFGWRLLVAIGAGAAAGLVAASRRDSEADRATPTSISLGTVSVGSPR